MEKTDKKEEKKKNGKKKDAPKEDSLTLLAEKLEREFNKKMKGVVKEVKKDTKKAIKNIMKEARQKIKDNTALIMQDLLKNTEPALLNITIPETEQSVVKAEPNENALVNDSQPVITETTGKAENQTALMPTPAKTTNARVRKTKAATAAASADAKPTRTRKPAAPKANPADTQAIENG